MPKTKYRLCRGCDQPMLPKGQKKKPNEYDHAQGCPEAHREIVQQIIAEITGTCTHTLEELAKDHGIELTRDDLLYIDSCIFHCHECGWWMEIEELSDSEDEQICIECRESQ